MIRSLKLNLCRSFSSTSSTILPHSVNIFNNVNLTLPEYIEPVSFEPLFKSSLQHFKERKHTGIWVHIPRSSLLFMHTLLQQPYKFDLHHVVPEDSSLVMNKWLKDSPSRLPPYTNHSAGAGGLVFNQKGELLMIQERYKFSRVAKWKLPGGLVDIRQNILDAAEREVEEETGVKSEAIGILGFRQLLNFRFGRTDMYFIVVCKALEEHTQIDLDPEQIARAEWKPLHQILSPDFDKFQTFKVVCEQLGKEMQKIEDPSQLVQRLKRRMLIPRNVASQFIKGEFKFFELPDC